MAFAGFDALIASVPLAVKAAMTESAAQDDGDDLAKELIARFAELEPVSG